MPWKSKIPWNSIIYMYWNGHGRNQLCMQIL